MLKSAISVKFPVKGKQSQGSLPSILILFTIFCLIIIIHTFRSIITIGTIYDDQTI
jgi:hypothetical protein